VREHLRFMSRVFIDLAALPMFSSSCFLVAVYAGHVIKKWWVVSLWDVHVWHIGELDFPILCRYFLGWMWLVLSCMSMAACLHDRCCVFQQKLEDRVNRSML